MTLANESSLQRHRLALVALLIVSSIRLIFEITPIRLFALFFQYHFAFPAVSLAVPGLSWVVIW